MTATYSAEEIIELTAGRMASGMTPDDAAPLVVDTRVDLNGAWFVAIVGRNYDGHDFIGDAFSAGALGCIVADRPSYPIAATSFPLIAVDDTEEALAALVRNWRKRTRKKIILVAATDLQQVSPLARTIFEELDSRLGQMPSSVSSSNDFSAPLVDDLPTRGPHLSTQFSLDPAAAFPTAAPVPPLYYCQEQVQSTLANWKLKVSEVLAAFLNLPDEVEYVVADFAPAQLDRAAWLVSALDPDCLVLADDSYDFARLASDAPDPILLKRELTETIRQGRGTAFTASETIADALSIRRLMPLEASSNGVNYQPLLELIGLKGQQ